MSRATIRLRDLPPDQRERITAVARVDAKPERMNKTETRRAEHLETLKRAGAVHDYRFEALNLRLGDATFFRPDFLVIRPDGAVELEDVKGRKGDGYWSEEDARVKIRTAATQYPWFRFFVVWESKGGDWNRGEVRGC